MKALTANRLSDGEVVFWNTGQWVERFGDAELFARVALARGLRWQFGLVDPALVTELEEARSRLGEGGGSLRARVLARLASAGQPSLDPSGPVNTAREAIAMAKPLSASDRLDVTQLHGRHRATATRVPMDAVRR